MPESTSVPPSRPPAGLKSRAQRDKLAVLLFMVAAFASFVFSVSLWFGGYRDAGLFVGIWVPSILSLGTLVMSQRPR